MKNRIQTFEYKEAKQPQKQWNEPMNWNFHEERWDGKYQSLGHLVSKKKNTKKKFGTLKVNCDAA